MPYSHLCERIASKDNAAANERDGLHVGDYDNTLSMLSMSPKKGRFTYQKFH